QGPIVSFKHASSSALNKMTNSNANTLDSTTFAGYGVGLANGESVSQTASCDGVIILWGEGTGTLTVKNGGSGGTTVATIDTSTGDGASNITSVPLGSYGSKNIWIGSTGDSIVEGVLPTVGNRTSGVRVWRCGNTG